jgi:hypothetical protein
MPVLKKSRIEGSEIVAAEIRTAAEIGELETNDPPPIGSRNPKVVKPATYTKGLLACPRRKPPSFACWGPNKAK